MQTLQQFILVNVLYCHWLMIGRLQGMRAVTTTDLPMKYKGRVITEKSMRLLISIEQPFKVSDKASTLELFLLSTSYLQDPRHMFLLLLTKQRRWQFTRGF